MKSASLHRRLACLLATSAVVLLSACATAPSSGPSSGPSNGTAGTAPTVAALNPIDPWEDWNRKVYGFNDSIDRAVLKPVAQTYRNVVPSPVRTGINNVLGNIRDVWSAANHVVQGKPIVGLEMGMRVLVNTFFGLGGLLDPATEMKLTKRPTDFGLTLATWGVGNGPYLMLPLLGPSTVRDTAGTVLDRQFGPSTLPPTTGGQAAVTTIEVINTRSNLLAAGQLLDQVALDKYSFLRDAYLASRRNAQYDGAPPMEKFDDDPGDDAPKPAAPAGSASAASSAKSATPAPTK
jgi:phospholipid-binding lipoprotein MlaA